MAQKIIKIGSSIGVVFPKPLVDELDFRPGQEIQVDAEGINRVVIERKLRRPNEKRADLVRWAATYVEKYRKDFERLANK